MPAEKGNTTLTEDRVNGGVTPVVDRLLVNEAGEASRPTSFTGNNENVSDDQTPEITNADKRVDNSGIRVDSDIPTVS